MARQEQVACIFCGRSSIRDKIDLSKFDNWSIDWVVLQVREMLAGPGRGKRIKGTDYGFPAIKEEGLSIIEMLDHEEHREVVEAIKGRLVKIVRAYLAAGIIEKEELVP